MSEKIRCRLMLARMGGDSEPCVIAAIDECVWENWDEATEDAWLRAGRETWGITYDTEYRVVWAEFAPADLVEAFGTPTVKGAVALDTGDSPAVATTKESS